MGDERPRYVVAPGGVAQGELTVPGDKSISHRALMLGALAQGRTEITGFLAGADCLSTLRALEALQVRIEHEHGSEAKVAPFASGSKAPQATFDHGRSEAKVAPFASGSKAPQATFDHGTRTDHVVVQGMGPDGLQAPGAPLDMGNAGTAIRLFMGLLAPQSFDSTLIGDASLMRRPMERVAVPLRLMGADIRTHDGRPPVHIRRPGRISAIDYPLPVASAQVKSAVLLAALRAVGRTRVTEPAPSRDHTERMLRAFGVEVQQRGATVTLDGGQTLRGAQIRVPADFSSAAFFIVGGCLGGRGLLVRNVGVNPTRTGLLRLLERMGADIRLHMQPDAGGAEPIADMGSEPVAAIGSEPIADIEVRPARLRGIDVPEALVPLSIDEFPVFFVAAACAEGETRLRGAAELRVKESDRLATMSEGLAALGVHSQLEADGILIRGGDGFEGGTVDSHGDHRVAMAFAIASLRARGPIEILDTANVATSFPGFVETARAAGLQIETA